MLNATCQGESACSRPPIDGSPGWSARIASRSASTELSSTRYSVRSFITVTICGSRVSGCSTTPSTSASGSSASTSMSPLATSTRISREVFASTGVMASSDRPSALNETTSLAVTSSAGTVSNRRQSSSIRSRTMRSRSPFGLGANPPRMTMSSSASQPMKPGFFTSRVISPVSRSSRKTSCNCGFSRLSPIRISVGNFLLEAMSRACTPSNGVRSRWSMVSRLTSCSRQFSSPPLSWMYSRCRPSCAQENMRMPRSRSSVTTRASDQSTASSEVARSGATQTFSTPSWGAIQASRVPSGDSRGRVRSGLPNRTSRGMRSVM